MEQNANIETSAAGAIDGSRQNNGKGLKVATIIASVIAVCGVSFGIYGMVQIAQKDSQISDLKAQIKDDDGAVTIIEAPEIGVTTDAAKISGGPYIESGYFYVPEWDLKFSIPIDLANYGYSVDYDSAHVGYTLPEVGFTAMLKSDELQGAQAAYYDNIQTCSMVNVSKESGTWPSDRMINGLIKQFDDYALLIWNYSSHGSCDYNLHIDEVQEKIQTMFSNPEKINI